LGCLTNNATLTTKDLAIGDSECGFRGVTRAENLGANDKKEQ